MKKVILIFSILSSIIFNSCSDFLKEFSQNNAYVEETSDLDELLSGECYIKSNNMTYISTLKDSYTSSFSVNDLLIYFQVLDDDIVENIVDYESQLIRNSKNPYSEMYGYYRWAEIPKINNFGNEISDPHWKDFYYRIAVINAVLAGADDLEEKGKSITELNRIRGEALFLRAWNYFMLCNIYGMPYDKSNPNDPYGVPLKIDPEVLDNDFKRNTVGVVYNQIIKDLENSVKYFNNSNKLTSKNFYTADINATYALLSRVYLYMEEYEKAIEAADNVLNATLDNLAEEKDESYDFAAVESVETIFNQGTSSLYLIQKGEGNIEVEIKFRWDPTLGIIFDTIETVSGLTYPYAVSNDLVKLFDENDLRYRTFFNRGELEGNLYCRKYRVGTSVSEFDPVTNEKVGFSRTLTAASSYCWLRYSEVLLNKMEAQACIGDGNVYSVLSDFLSKRYKIIPEVPSSGMDLVKFIRNERRKELCFEGHRWFDLRRYAVSSFEQKIEVTHTCFDSTLDVDGDRIIRHVGTRTLKAYDESTRGNWTIPIPDHVLDANHGAITNLSRDNGVESNIN